MVKKSLLIIQESLYGGGAERVLIEYLNNISYKNYSITLLLLYGGGRYIKDINNKVITKFIYNSRPSNRIQERIMLNRYVLNIRLKQLAIEQKYDVIISFMEGPSLYVHSLLLDKAYLNISWVHTNVITNPWSERFFNGNECSIYQKLDRIAFVSKQAKDAFIQKYQLTTSMLEVINNPIDSVRISKEASNSFIDNEGIFTVISIGRLVEAKRFDRLLDAAKLLKERGCNINYWICGAGKLEEELKLKVTNLQLTGNVKFWGFLDNPYPYLKAADVFVLTSDSEGFPTVICEALVLGKPVISTDVPGTDELLGNSEYGFVCNKTSKDIADAIYALYSDKNLLYKYSIKALERSSEFNIERTMCRFIKLLDYENDGMF